MTDFDPADFDLDDAEFMFIDPHAVTTDMLETLGMGQIAYVRPGVLPSGKNAIAIHAANGDVIGFADTIPTAHATVLQNEMESFSVH